MAIRTTYDLFDFLPGSLGSFGIQATDKDGNTQTLISSDNSKKYMLHKYGTRRYSILTGMDPATASDANTAFIEDFTLWVANRQKNIDLQYQALFDYPYSPIENYDRYESETINKDVDVTYGKKSTLSGSDSITYGKKNTEGGSDSITYGKKDTLSGSDSITYGHKNTEGGSDSITYGKKDTLSGHDDFTHDVSDDLTKTGTETHTIQKAGFNSPNDYTPDTKDTTTFTSRKDAHAIDQDDRTTYGKVDTLSGSDTTNYGKTDTESGSDTTQYGKVDTLSGTDSTTYGKTDTLSGTDTTNYGRVDTASGTDTTDDDTERSAHIHGNIGVTTSSAMIKEVLEMRSMSLAEMLIDNFINDYTFYS